MREAQGKRSELPGGSLQQADELARLPAVVSSSGKRVGEASTITRSASNAPLPADRIEEGRSPRCAALRERAENGVLADEVDEPQVAEGRPLAP